MDVHLVATHHYPKDAFRCEHCPKSYCYRPSLLRHRAIVHGEYRKYPCENCSKVSLQLLFFLNSRSILELFSLECSLLCALLRFFFSKIYCYYFIASLRVRFEREEIGVNTEYVLCTCLYICRAKIIWNILMSAFWLLNNLRFIVFVYSPRFGERARVFMKTLCLDTIVKIEIIDWWCFSEGWGFFLWNNAKWSEVKLKALK